MEEEVEEIERQKGQKTKLQMMKNKKKNEEEVNDDREDK